jgi:putative PIN family toxin of toxin-antitoxin system
LISAVLDANALASGAITTGGPLAVIFEAWRIGDLVVYVSAILREEVARTLQKAYFRQRLTPVLAQRFELLMVGRARTVEVLIPVSEVATHPEDDLVLATAVSASVQYLVTGDIQLQKLGSYQGVTILSPRDFLTVLERDRRGRQD